MLAQTFSGLKVLDLSWIIAGPWVVKYLADAGAEVVHVESMTHLDSIRTSPPFKDNVVGPDRTAYFVNYHCNQYGMTVDLNHASGKGIELIKKLVQWADIVIENFSPGMMERWGLDYDTLKKLKNDIVMVRTSQFGQTGSMARVPGTGNQLVSLSGFTHLTGYPDRDPSNLYGGFTDTGSARLTAVALLAALCHRHRTGKGQYIDASQYEAGGVHFLAPLILGYMANGSVPKREGNRNAHAAPHNVYPCKGEDRWCAITVFDDREWEGLCKGMGVPYLKDDPRFITLAERKAHEQELDHVISKWTRGRDRRDVMATLQGMGVPCGMVSDARDLYEDPQLNHRGYYQEVDHPVVGKHRYESQAFTFTDSPFKLRSPAPLIGQHNEHVCTKILKMSDEEFVELLSAGVLE